MPILSVVIVTYNSHDQIGLLLDSLQKEKKSVDFEVIVVDNQYSDNSFLLAKNHPLKPRCHEMGSNAGFPTAINRGLKDAAGDYFLILNPDTIILPGTLKKLLEFAQDTSPLGGVVPRLLNPDGKPQASVYKFPTIANAIRKDFFNCQNCFGKYLPDKRTQKVEVAVMAAFLIPRSTYETVGGLNEKYFMYYEDFDFCRELRLRNLPLYYLPAARVKHVHGASGHFVYHLKSPLLASARLYYGVFYSDVLNFVLWVGHKWQVLLRGKRFRD